MNDVILALAAVMALGLRAHGGRSRPRPFRSRCVSDGAGGAFAVETSSSLSPAACGRSFSSACAPTLPCRWRSLARPRGDLALITASPDVWPPTCRRVSPRARLPAPGSASSRPASWPAAASRAPRRASAARPRTRSTPGSCSREARPRDRLRRGPGAAVLMALDWYSTATGRRGAAHREPHGNPSGAEAGEIDRRAGRGRALLGRERREERLAGGRAIDRDPARSDARCRSSCRRAHRVHARRGARPTKGLGPAGARRPLRHGARPSLRRLPDHPGARARRRRRS